MVVALFAGLDRHVQIVSLRWQRTGRKGSEGTRRVLGLVEIKNGFTVHGLVGVKKSSRRVSLVRVRLVAEDDKQSLIFFYDWLKRILFPFEADFQRPRALHLKFSSEYIWTHHSLRLGENSR